MTRRRDAALAFDAIRIKGGLFNPEYNPEYLAKVTHRDAPKQSDADTPASPGPPLSRSIWSASSARDYTRTFKPPGCFTHRTQAPLGHVVREALLPEAARTPIAFR
jgi:hypothetical protein